MLTFTKTMVDGFRHTNKSLRYGQAFYGYAKLHKVTNAADKAFCDRLFNASDDAAKAMIASRTDKTQ